MAASVTDVLRDVQQDIEDTLKRLAELRAVETYLTRRTGNGQSPLPPAVTQKSSLDQRFEGKMKFEACEIVLRRAGKPMKTSEIAQFLHASGYARDMKLNALANALFTAMKRKPETFSKPAPGTWGLVESQT